MPVPVTALVGCEVFVLNERREVLLVERADDGTWCMPGGCQDLGETPAQCAVRECREESGYEIRPLALLGVFSSLTWPWVHYIFKDNQFVHILFHAELCGGEARGSAETTRVGWFNPDSLPLMMDGHEDRIRLAYRHIASATPAHFE